MLPLASNKNCQHNHVQSGENAEANQCFYGSTEGNVPSAAPTSSPEITSFDLNRNRARPVMGRFMSRHPQVSDKVKPSRPTAAVDVAARYLVYKIFDVICGTPETWRALMKRQKPWRGLWRAVGWWCTTTNENTGLLCGL